MKLLKFNQFLTENKKELNSIPTYDQCLELCALNEAAFYETKSVVEGYNISVFNYRFASYLDFNLPGAKELRGITYVFNEDGSLFNRFVLLEKFFNINQVPESMYSIVKNYKIKYINNKEDGSIATFIKLPNDKIIGKSKMGFTNDQAKGINRIYKTNDAIKKFVDWCLNDNIIPIFEYVAPSNKIVLRYDSEELILLRLRNNITGEHIDIRDHLDKIGEIKIAPFEDDYKDLDDLIEVVATQVDKEGCIVTTEDEMGKTFMFKLKTPWYNTLHGVLTNDVYRENVIINYILDNKIDDVLGQIPEDDINTHERINKIISIVKKSISDTVNDLKKSFAIYQQVNDRRKYAIEYKGVENYHNVLAIGKGVDIYEIAEETIRDKTKRLLIAREFLKEKDPSLFFEDPKDDTEE